jgi:S-formylglutathione hydrolase FrmB
MKKWIFALVLLALISIGWTAWSRLTSPYGDQKVVYTPSQKECFDGNTEKSWRYCIHTPAGGDNGVLAYFLHGRNLDENIWNDDTFYTSMIQKYWAEKQIKPPKVVTVSFGRFWLLTPKMSTPSSGLLDTFLNQVMPAVESKTAKPAQRWLFGESMGGLNTLAVALSTNNLFQKAASLCPVIYEISPQANLSEIQKFLEQTGADPKIIFGVRQMASEYFANESEWKRFSPLDLIETADPKATPEIYMSVGLYDKYGNFQGAAAFARKAKERGFRLQWRPLYGGHCVTDIVSVAEFLSVR